MLKEILSSLWQTIPGAGHTELRAKRQRSARESGRQVECPYRDAGKASALGAGSHIPKSAYSCQALPGARRKACPVGPAVPAASGAGAPTTTAQQGR